MCRRADEPYLFLVPSVINNLRSSERAHLRANGAYIWVTWLPKLLSGLNSCEWASWFKAQHYSDSWARMPSDFDLSKWLTAHTALLNKSRVTRERKGYSVLTEGGNHTSCEPSVQA